MIQSQTHLGDQKRISVSGLPVKWAELIIALSIFLTMGVLYYSETTSLPSYIFRFLALLPIVLVVYQYGLTIGFIVSGLYSSAFLPSFIALVLAGENLTGILELGAFLLFLNVSTYVIADTLNSLRSQRALESDVKDWEILMSKALSLEEVFNFLLQETRGLLDVEDVLLLTRTPMGSEWKVITEQTRKTLQIPSVVDTGSQQFTLAQWLLLQRVPTALNNLDQSDQSLLQDDSMLHSLLMYPLNDEDGTLLGAIVLFNKRGGSFSKRDFQKIAPLAMKGGSALQQAGLYAKTDQALARRVEELTMIQHTARALNATLDPEEIMNRTLACALDLCRGEVGGIVLDTEGLPPTIQYQGVEAPPEYAQALLAAAKDVREAHILTETEKPPSLSEASTARLLAPICLGDRFLGSILVERHTSQPFEAVTLYALTSLTEHTATALENARLFKDICREKQRTDRIIQSAADGLFTVNRELRILLFNPAAAELTGWTAEDVWGRPYIEVLRCTENPLRNAMETHEVIQDQRMVIHQQLGTKRVIALSAAPLLDADGTVYGAVALFRDVTEREQLERIQHEFIAAVSHELRSPLTKISMALEMMYEKQKSIAEEDKQYIHILKDQCRQLTAFADRILEVYRLETDKIDLQRQPIPLIDLISDRIQALSTFIRSHTLRFDAPSDIIWVMGDENAIQTVLNNLLDNAVKYAPAGTDIEISLVPAPPHHVTVRVRDQGPGIAPEHQSRVFGKFYRIHGDDAQSVYGHGLGLYIAKRLVEAMDGDIWLESDEGTGSQFAFTLPTMEENHE